MNSGASKPKSLARATFWLASLFVVAVSSHCTSANPDYPDAFSCQLGDRSCGSASAGQPARPLVCGHDASDSLALLTERCPAAASCDSGHCIPSGTPKSCQQQADCSTGQSCVPLVSGTTLSLFCVSSDPGTLPAGAACSADSDCQSAFCLQHTGGRFCLLACTGLTCQRPAVCQTLNITVTGIQGTVGSCGPP